MKKTYQGMKDKSKGKFEVLGKRELLVEVPLPMVEVWEELQAQVEQLTGAAGLRVREVATKSRAVKLHQSCYSPVDGMKNTGDYLQNRISSINCKSSKLNEIVHTRLFVV